MVHLLVKKEEFSGDIPGFCKKNRIHHTFFEKEINDVHLYRFNSLKNTLLYFYNYFKQVSFLWKVWFQVKPQMSIISQGWPFMWFRALYLPGKKIFVQHVMPLHNMDKGGRLFLKLALFFRQGTFIAVSNFAQRKMRKYWLGNYPKVQTIYNYVEADVINTNREKKDIITVLCLARVEEGKNPLLWADLAHGLTKKYQQVVFTWAGKGSLLDEARLKTKNNDRINFIGFVNNVDTLYAQADIYFEPSKREAHGISVVGAMAWKIPAIATNNGGTTESVVDGKTGFIVDVQDHTEMLDKLEILINDADLRIQMGIEARKRYKKLFTKEIWEKEMDKIIRL